MTDTIIKEECVKEEERRKLIDLSLKAGRKRKRAQTGYIHYCYESASEHDTIPLFENFCFSLALFRSKLTDDVKEAKTLLEKLLAFEANGNFPVYLHEFPECRDSYLSLNLLPVFYFIIENFSSVLGEELYSSLEKVTERIVNHAHSLEKLGAFSKEAEHKLNAFAKIDIFSTWAPKTLSQWGHFLVSLQMNPDVDQKKYLEAAAANWHPQLLCYVGLYGKALHYKIQPAPTLFDLFMGSIFGSYPARALEDSPLHIQAALIHPFHVSVEKPLASKNYSFCIHEEGENALTLKWGSGEHLHSLAIPKLKSLVDCELFEEGCQLTFQLPEALPAENEDEVALFCDNHKNNNVWISQKKATLFTLSDVIEIASQDSVIQITFSQEGEGMFAGHILRANRPFQIGAKGEDVFEAFDWKMAIRTLRRELNCKLKVTIKFKQAVDNSSI